MIAPAPAMLRSEVPRVRALTLLALGACYSPNPSGLPTIPYEAPILEAEGIVEVCAPERLSVVACVVDGDTLDLTRCGLDGGGERVRLLGIDAPETEKPGTEADCYGDIASRELSRLLLGRSVWLSFDAECEGVFQRTLAYVWMDQEDAEVVMSRPLFEDLLESQTSEVGMSGRVMINTYLLLGGFVTRFDEAWVEPLKWQSELIEAEQLARARRQGLWSTCQ